MKLNRLFQIVFVLSTVAALGQEAETQKLREIEAQKEAQRASAIRSQLDSAIVMTDAGQYAAADTKYMYVLRNLKSLPSDLAFHFGRNSFELGKYSQAVDWLNKYIQLKGTNGQFYDRAVEIKGKSEQGVLKEKQSQSAEAAAILSKNFDIDCGPSGKVTCPVCNGSTVVIKKTYFGESYKTCATCNKNGYLNCDDYNKLLRGELKPNH